MCKVQLLKQNKKTEKEARASMRHYLSKAPILSDLGRRALCSHRSRAGERG